MEKRINIVEFVETEKRYRVIEIDVDYIFEYKGHYIAVHQSSHDAKSYSATELYTGFAVNGINIHNSLYPKNPREAARIAKKNIDMYDVEACKKEAMANLPGIKFPINKIPSSEKVLNGIVRMSGAEIRLQEPPVETEVKSEFKNKKLSSMLDNRLNRFS